MLARSSTVPTDRIYPSTHRHRSLVHFFPAPFSTPRPNKPFSSLPFPSLPSPPSNQSIQGRASAAGSIHTMKLVWCPDTASKAYIDGVRAIAAHADADGSPELAELLAAMAGGWNAQLIVDAPVSPPSSSSRRPPAATSLALAAAARRTGGRYAVVPMSTEEEHDADDDSGSSSSSSAATEAAAMARLEGVDLLVLDARRRDAAAVLRAARPGPRGMVVVRHGGNNVVRRGRAAAAPPWGMAAGTRVVRAAYLPICAGGVEVLHVGVGKGPSLLPPSQSQHSVRRPAGRGRWIRHVNHRTGEEHVFRRQ